MTTKQKVIVIGLVVLVVIAAFSGLCFALEPIMNPAYTPVLLGI